MNAAFVSTGWKKADRWVDEGNRAGRLGAGEWRIEEVDGDPGSEDEEGN